MLSPRLAVSRSQALVNKRLACPDSAANAVAEQSRLDLELEAINVRPTCQGFLRRRHPGGRPEPKRLRVQEGRRSSDERNDLMEMTRLCRLNEARTNACPRFRSRLLPA